MEIQQPWDKNTEQFTCPQQIYLELPIDVKKEFSTESKRKDLQMT